MGNSSSSSERRGNNTVANDPNWVPIAEVPLTPFSSNKPKDQATTTILNDATITSNDATNAGGTVEKLNEQQVQTVKENGNDKFVDEEEGDDDSLPPTPYTSNRKKDQGVSSLATIDELSSSIPIPIQRTQNNIRPISPGLSVATNNTAHTEWTVKKKADVEVVFRDIIACYLDMACDVIYLVYMFLHRSFSWRELPTKFDMCASLLLTASIIGIILSCWMIGASLERKYRGTMRFYGCTVPNLSMYLVVLHHIPIIILTPIIDTAFLGGFSVYGMFNIGSSLFAMAISLHTTRCGTELSVVDDADYLTRTSMDGTALTVGDNTIIENGCNASPHVNMFVKATKQTLKGLHTTRIYKFYLGLLGCCCRTHQDDMVANEKDSVGTASDGSDQSDYEEMIDKM